MKNLSARTWTRTCAGLGLASFLWVSACVNDGTPNDLRTGESALSTCEILEPLDGATLGATHDRSVLQGDLQVDVAVRYAGAPVGSALEIVVDQARLVATTRVTASDGVHRFEGVTLGASAGIARVGCRIGGRAGAQVAVEVGAPCALRFVQPSLGARVSRFETRPAAGGRHVYPAIVEADGLAPGTLVRVETGEPGAATFAANVPLAGNRAVVEIPVSAGPSRVFARAMGAACAPTAEARFEVEGGECSATLMLPRTFTSASDRSPAPGFQGRVCVMTSCPDGSLATLQIENGASPQADVRGGEACFDVSIAEGAPTITARVESPMQGGTSPASRLCVDVTPPSIAVSYPPAGLRVGRRDDRDPSTPNAIEIPVSGSASGFVQAGCVVPASQSVIELRVNGERQATMPPEATNATFDLVARLLPGRNEVQVCASDSVGNRSCAPASIVDVSLDLPALRFASPANGSVLGHGPSPGERRFDVVVDAYRLGVGTEVILSTHDGAWSCAALTLPSNEGMRATFAIGGACPRLPDGAHRLRARATDSLGNEALSPELALRLDTQPPSLSFVSPSEGAAFSMARIDVSLATDAADGETASLRLNESQPIFAQAAGGFFSFRGLDLPEGPSTLTAEMHDEAGNPTVVRRRVVVDTHVPAPSFVNLSASRVLGAEDDLDRDLANGLQYDVRVSVPGEPDGATLSLQVGDRAPQSALLAGGMATFASVELPEGPSRVSLVVIDAAGNDGRAFVDVRVHTGRPIVAITSPADGASFTASADADPGIEGVQIPIWIETVDAPPMTSCAVVVDAGLAGEERIPLEADGSYCRGTITLAEGRRTIVAEVEAQGSGRSVPIGVTIDTQAPSLSFDSPSEVINASVPDGDARAGFQTDVVVRADAIEAGQGAVLTALVDGSSVPALYFAVFDADGRATFRGVGFDDGVSSTLSAQAVDLAGNVSNVAVRRVSVDRTVPTVAILSPADGALFGLAADESPVPGFQKSITVQYASFESGRPVEVTLSSAEPGAPSVTYVSAPVSDTAGTVTFSAVGFPTSAGETVIVRARAIDSAGNEGATEARVRVDVANPGVAWVSPSATPSPATFCASADVDPAAPGHQQDVDVATVGVPSGSAVAVHDALGFELGRGTVANDAARVRVKVPAGDTVVRATVTKPSGNEATTADARTIRVDAAGPAILSFACNGDQNNDGFINRAEDRNPATANRAEMDCVVTFADDSANGREVRIHSSYPADGTLAGAGIATGNLAFVSVSLDAQSLVAAHRLTVVTSDACGNAASGAGSYDVVVDFVMPTAAILQPTGGSLLASADQNPGTDALECCTGASGAYAITASVSGAALARLYANGAQVAEATVGSGGTVSFPSAVLPQGNVALTVEAVSAAGNVALSPPVNLFVDSVVPKLTIVSPSAGTVGTNALNVRIDYRDLEFGRVIALMDGSELLTEVVAQAGPDASTRTAIVPIVLRPGAHNLRAFVSDASGNVGTAGPIAIDVQANDPIVTVESPSSRPIVLHRASGAVVGAAVHVDVTVRTLAPAGSIASLLKNGAEVATVLVAPSTPQNVAVFTGVPFADNESGNLEAKVRFETSDTNASCPGDASTFCSGAIAFSTDITAPTLSLTSPACKPTWNLSDANGSGAFDVVVGTNAGDGRTVTLESTRGGVSSIASISGGVASMSGVPLLDGSQTITMRVSDDAGNETSITCDVVVDTVAPTIETFGAARSNSRRDRISLSWPGPVDASAGGVASYEIRYRSCAIGASCPVDAGTWSSASALTGLPALEPGGTPMSFDVDRLMLDQRFAFGIRATDAAGNVSQILAAAATTALTAETHAGVAAEADWGFALRAVRLTASAASEIVVGRPRAASLGGGFRVLFADGRTPVDVLASDVGLASTTARMGRSLASAGDLDGDGYDDLIVGAPAIADATCTGGTGPETGRVYLFFGGPNGVRAAAGGHQACGGASDAECYIEIPAPVGSGVCSFGQSVAGVGSLGTTAGARPMFAVGAGDLTASSSRQGKAFVYRLVGDRPNVSVELVATVNGGADDYHFGASVCGVGDVNGDGAPDFVVGATRRGQTPVVDGRAYLVMGGTRFDGANGSIDIVSGGAAPDDGIVRLGVQFAADNFGTACSPAGDGDGDGKPDFVITAPGSLRVYVVRGRADLDVRPAMDPGEMISLAHASWVQPGEVSAGVDFDGDGLSDVVVGDTTAAYVFRGDASSGVFAAPIATFSQSSSVSTGYPVAFVSGWKENFAGEAMLPDLAIGRVTGPAIQIRY